MISRRSILRAAPDQDALAFCTRLAAEGRAVVALTDRGPIALVARTDENGRRKPDAVFLGFPVFFA